MLYECSPAWSIKGKSPPRKEEDIPGPGSYHVETNLLRSRSACNISKAVRFTYKETEQIGFGAYEIKLRVNSPAFKFSSASKDNSKTTEIPGPGSYEPDKTFNITTPRKISSEPRFKETINDSPGPGAYETKERKSGSPTFRFGKQAKSKEKTEDLIGPGHYYVPVGFDKKGAILLGKPKEKQIDESPGPGAYTLEKRNDYRLASVSKSSRFIVKKQEVPGPGAYDAIKRSSTPKTIFGTSKRSSFVAEKDKPASSFSTPRKIDNAKVSLTGKNTRRNFEYTPGPGQYECTPQKNAPIAVFSKAKKEALTSGKSKEAIPGPGSYNLRSKFLGPAYSMGTKSTDKLENEVPGPGNYDLNTPEKPRSASVVSKGKRFETSFAQKHTESVPGPGQYYNYNFKSSSPGFSFKKDKKCKETSKEVPGPGQYDIKSSIPNISHYFNLSSSN